MHSWRTSNIIRYASHASITRGKRQRGVTNLSICQVIQLTFVTSLLTLIMVTLHLVFHARKKQLLVQPSRKMQFINLHFNESRPHLLKQINPITNLLFSNEENISSVDYMACCGAGHRLSKMADAYYLAQQINFTLRGYWGYCDTYATHGQLTEVFHHLFGPQTIPTYHIDGNKIPKQLNTSMNHYARINNDVHGFHKLMRTGNHCDICDSSSMKAKSDYNFYTNLRHRFRLRESVDNFYHHQLLHITSRTNSTIVGVHIRAGNGESGDFHARGRYIENTNLWLSNLTNLILNQGRVQHWGNTTLFLATDTPSLIDQLRQLIQDNKIGKQEYPNITIVTRDQFRPAEGFGVLFGQQAAIQRSGDDCLRGWEDTIVDMMLLSYVDVLIAGRPSSFTQSLPMSLVLGRTGSSRRFTNPYCEVNQQATEIQCFSNFTDWCCRGRTSFALQGIQRYEYLRVPGKLFDTKLNLNDPILQKNLKLQKRPEFGCIPLPAGSKQVCLPYDWSKFHVQPRPPQQQLLLSTQA